MVWHTSAFNIPFNLILRERFKILVSDMFSISLLSDKYPLIPTAFQFPATEVIVINSDSFNLVWWKVTMDAVSICVNESRLIYSMVVHLGRSDCKVSCVRGYCGTDWNISGLLHVFWNGEKLETIVLAYYCYFEA